MHCVVSISCGNELRHPSHDQPKPDQWVDCNNKCNLDQFIPFHRHTKPDEQGDVLPSEEAMSFVFLGRLDRQFSASNCSLNDASSPSVVMPREIRVPLRVRL